MPGATSVTLSEDTLTADLSDGRTISVPLAWYPRLIHATPEERGRWELHAAGQHIHWPDLDEDLSVEGLLAGRPLWRRPGSRSGAGSRRSALAGPLTLDALFADDEGQ